MFLEIDGGNGMIETAAAVLAKWPGAEAVTATPREINSYLRKLQLPKKTYGCPARPHMPFGARLLAKFDRNHMV